MEKFCLGKKEEIVLSQWFEITKAFGSQCEFFLFSHFSSKLNGQGSLKNKSGEKW